MPLTPDRSLAQALEGAEAAACRMFCETAAAVHPGKGIRCISCGGGFGLFYGPGDPLNAVKGVGLNGPVEMGEWEVLEEQFRSSGSPVVVDLCSLADEAFAAELGRRGYRIGSFETVLFRSLEDALPQSRAVPGCRIAQVGAAEAVVWGRTIDAGFADGGEPIKFSVDFGAVRARLAGSVMLLATVDGVPAGAAGFSVQGTVAHMNGAAVLPAYRRRGIQTALTAARLSMAKERGCAVAKLDVQAGSISHRNAARAGFMVAYTRPQLVRAWT